MGSILEIAFIMLIVASLAFAPLGYFIYRYTRKNGEPFGEIEPHGDRQSLVLDYVEKAILAIKKRI
jgi:hypothetical protein